MRIKTISLKNIRSHAESTIEFKKGFNCIVGGLGVGKSSILYAIDFVLFGDPLTRTYSYLLREGSNTGKVSLEFTINSKAYRIERGLKKRGTRISQNVEHLKLYQGDRVIASMKNEAVAEQLKSITGLDKGIFREVVWVRQERLKELLNLAPRQRQTRLDQLFGLSDYEVAWTNMRGVQREYEIEQRTFEKDYDVLGMDKLESEYHQSVEEFSTAEAEAATLAKKLEEFRAEVETASTRLQALEHMREQNARLSKREAELKTIISSNQKAAGRIERDLKRKRQLIKELRQRSQDIEAGLGLSRKQLQEINLPVDVEGEELKVKLLSFNEQVTSLKAEREAARKEGQVSNQRLHSLKTENRCPLCLQTINQNYKAHLQKHAEEENVEREQRLSELGENIQELETLKEIVTNAAFDIQSRTPRLQDTETRIIDEEESQRDLEGELAELQANNQQLQTHLAEIRSELAEFNQSKLARAQNLYEQAKEQLRTVNMKLELCKRSKENSAAKIEEYRERLEQAQKKLKRAQKINQLLESIEAIRNAYRSIQPRLRVEIIKILERMIQQVLDSTTGGESDPLIIRVDEAFTPYFQSSMGLEREVAHLSGGERTLIAFAYRFALGQLILQAQTGHGLRILLLDEPTESLGREDYSVSRLAETIARLKAIEQIITVTHNEAFAERGDHIIRLEKESGESRAIS